MKFDVVVGNPPYNLPTKIGRGGNGSGTKIWQRFVEVAFEHLEENGIVAMVIPTTWRHGNFNKHRQHKRAQELIFRHGVSDWADAKKHFPMVGHSIGIDWWLSKKGSSINIETNPTMLLSRNNDQSMLVMHEWLEALKGECYEQNVGSNTYLNFEYIHENSPRENFIYPHSRTGATTKKKMFDWYQVKTKSFDEPKVIIHRSSGPGVFYDKEGKFGCGDKAHAYLISNDKEAQEIMDFFSSKFCDWLVHQAAEKNAIAFPTFLFKCIPKNWRVLEEKHFG